MRKKKAIIILLTVLIFLSASVLGVSTVYRIKEVTVRAVLVSEAAKAEADALQAELQLAYEKTSTLFLDRENADALVEKYPYFRITAFEKQAPNRLIVEISEDAEVYAVAVPQTLGEYYILNADGVVLGVRADTKNRSDQAENLPIRGLKATETNGALSGEKGEKLVGDACLDTLFAFLNKVSTSLNGIRRNVSYVEVVRPVSLQEETVFKLSMREGVNIYVRNPFALTLQKAQTLVNAYLSLTSEQKLKGSVMLSDVAGEVQYNYTPIDVFA